jgi:putative membrane protein
VWALVALVVATEIPYPLVHGQARDVLTVVTVLVFASASLTHAAVTRSWRTAAAMLAVFGAGGLAAEVVGVHTGVPFGDYGYTGGLGPGVAGVPLVIGLAWLMMAWPSICVAARITTATWARIGTAVVALASWDVFLDPQMVDAGHWRWRHPDPHLPGIGDVPLTNFGGWLLVSMLLMTVAHRLPGQRETRDDGPMVAPMVTLWIWTWLSSALANVAFFHHPAVAGWGLLAMGIVGVPLLTWLRPTASSR